MTAYVDAAGQELHTGSSYKLGLKDSPLLIVCEQRDRKLGRAGACHERARDPCLDWRTRTANILFE